MKSDRHKVVESVLFKLPSIKIAVIYAVFGGLWILFSDMILESMVSDTATLSAIQTYKGWLYVFITACLVYALVLNLHKKLHTYLSQLEMKNLALNLEINKTQQKEQQIQGLLQNLEEKNQELERIIYASSHDLRSPLVNIQGFSAELAKDCKTLCDSLSHTEKTAAIKSLLEKDIPESIHFIQSSANSMDSLQNSLLKICRLGRETTNPENIDMNQLTQNVLATLKYKQQSNEISIDVSDMPICYADPQQIEQAFTNLIGNAIKYLRPNMSGHIEISGWSQGNQSYYKIKDNGIGIKEDYHSKIFELFHRLDPKSPVKGDGIGLTIVKQMLLRNNGEISVDSKVNHGSEFTIKLPEELQVSADTEDVETCLLT